MLPGIPESPNHAAGNNLVTNADCARQLITDTAILVGGDLEVFTGIHARAGTVQRKRISGNNAKYSIK